MYHNQTHVDELTFWEFDDNMDYIKPGFTIDGKSLNKNKKCQNNVKT